jgi:formate dehydrogenase major subunit
VTARMAPLTVAGKVVHQLGLPYHWGGNGLVPGDSANDLLHSALDANVHIMETKAATADIIAGRRPRGPALRQLVMDYQRRAGVTSETGTR